MVPIFSHHIGVSLKNSKHLLTLISLWVDLASPVVLVFLVMSSGASIIYRLEGLVHPRGLSHRSAALVMLSVRLGSAV